jgi:hypothetical protein
MKAFVGGLVVGIIIGIALMKYVFPMLKIAI